MYFKVELLQHGRKMSWSPKSSTGTISFTEGETEGLVIKFEKRMSIRELNQIQQLSTEQASENMEALCDIISSKIIEWNYKDKKPTADVLLDMPYDITSEVTSKIMEAIVGTPKNLEEPSQNGLHLEEVSEATARQ